MPPEICAIKRGDHYDPKLWDVFSMSMIFYYVFSGKRPLHEFENHFVINEEIQKGTRPVLPPEMPTNVRDICRTMWEADYTKRPSIDVVSLRLHKLYQHTNIIMEENHLEMNQLQDQVLQQSF